MVAKLDRLARSFPDYADLIRLSAEEGWQLLALDAPDASTSHGEAMQAIVAVFAQLERRLISDRTIEATRPLPRPGPAACGWDGRW